MTYDPATATTAEVVAQVLGDINEALSQNQINAQGIADLNAEIAYLNAVDTVNTEAVTVADHVQRTLGDILLYHQCGAGLIDRITGHKKTMDDTVALDPDNGTLDSVDFISGSSLHLDTIGLQYAGPTYQLQPVGKNAAGHTLAGITFTYASDDSTVASVDSGGLVTVHKSGTCTLSATGHQTGNPDKTGYIAFTGVNNLLDHVVVSPTNPSIASGTTQQFTSTPKNSQNATIDGAYIYSHSWESSDVLKATITSPGGLATGSGAGNTTITAFYVQQQGDNPVSASTTLTVTASTLAEDTFTEASSTALHSHIPDLGFGGWDNGCDAQVHNGFLLPQSASQFAACTSDIAFDNLDISIALQPPASPNTSSQFLVALRVHNGGTHGGIYVGVKYDGTNYQPYYVEVDNTGGLVGTGDLGSAILAADFINSAIQGRIGFKLNGTTAQCYTAPYAGGVKTNHGSPYTVQTAFSSTNNKRAGFFTNGSGITSRAFTGQDLLVVAA
jgi:hypothetical protein